MQVRRAGGCLPYLLHCSKTWKLVLHRGFGHNIAMRQRRSNAMRSWILLAALCGAMLPGLGQEAAPNRNAIAIEALNRLEGVDLGQNPGLKTAVLKVLETTRGTPDFVKLVKKFSLTNQEPGLLEVAVKMPSEEPGVEAMQILLAGGNLDALQTLLKSTNNVGAARAVQAMGNTGQQQIVPMLKPMLSPQPYDVSVRKQAVRALSRTLEGAKTVLEATRNGTLAEDLKFVAGAELAAVRWPEIKNSAKELLPPPQGRDAQPLPPMAELLRLQGDAARGAKVFASEGPSCAKCHRARGQGNDVGPDLSEIGTKLGTDAIFDAILDPSAGISFGYEVFELELKSGDEAYGLIVSETGEEVAIKDAQGVVTRHRKSDIVSRRQMRLSIMPSDLQQTMATQDLVDLVAYLSSLKKEMPGQ